MRWSTSRVEAFSDGVIAIAITLLVLEIGVDPGALAEPWRALADQWPSYLAYVTSFLTVGSVWLAHHSLFSRLREVDATLMRLNIALLMLVSFLPFPTQLDGGRPHRVRGGRARGGRGVRRGGARDRARAGDDGAPRRVAARAWPATARRSARRAPASAAS